MRSLSRGFYPHGLCPSAQRLFQAWCWLGACLSYHVGMPVSSLVPFFLTHGLNSQLIFDLPHHCGLAWWLLLCGWPWSPSSALLCSPGRTAPSLGRALPCLSCHSSLLLMQFWEGYMYLCACQRVYVGVYGLERRSSLQMENNSKKRDLSCFVQNCTDITRKLNLWPYFWAVSLLTLVIFL